MIKGYNKQVLNPSFQIYKIDVNHQTIGQALQSIMQLLGSKLFRHAEMCMGVKEHAACHGGFFQKGIEGLDTDACIRQNATDVAHYSRVILTKQL